MEHPLTEQAKSRSTKHHTLDKLNPQHVPFRLAGLCKKSPCQGRSRFTLA